MSNPATVVATALATVVATALATVVVTALATVVATALATAAIVMTTARAGIAGVAGVCDADASVVLMVPIGSLKRVIVVGFSFVVVKVNMMMVSDLA